MILNKQSKEKYLRKFIIPFLTSDLLNFRSNNKKIVKNLNEILANKPLEEFPIQSKCICRRKKSPYIYISGIREMRNMYRI